MTTDPALVTMKQLTVQAGTFTLGPIDLLVYDHEYLVLLGPPGSGKSMLMECLCGLRSIASGTLQLAGRDARALPPRRRRIGFVPQDYALFPHRRVAGNIGYGLGAWFPSIRHRQAIVAICDRLGIGALIDRPIAGLSGGEQQRVALARAVITQPQLLLLDEPVSALDEQTRSHICELLKEIHSDLRLTTVHISHNLEEAATVSDRIAIFNQGRLQQCAPLSHCLQQPANCFVAAFLRAENLLAAEVTQHTVQILAYPELRLPAEGHCDGPATVVIRPEWWSVSQQAPTSSDGSTLNLVVLSIRDRGAFLRIIGEQPQVEHGRGLIIDLPYRQAQPMDLKQGSTLWVRVEQHWLLGACNG